MLSKNGSVEDALADAVDVGNLYDPDIAILQKSDEFFKSFNGNRERVLPI